MLASILLTMVQYMYELWQDIVDCVRQYRILTVAVLIFVVGVAIGIVSVDGTVVIVDTASGEYILLLVSSGSVLTIFLQLLIDALVLLLVLWALSFTHVLNYCKALLILYLGYSLGVFMYTASLMCGILSTVVIILIYMMYMLVLSIAVIMSYSRCYYVYGCRGNIDCRLALSNNAHSILVVILTIFAMILLNFIIIRPICTVI